MTTKRLIGMILLSGWIFASACAPAQIVREDDIPVVREGKGTLRKLDNFFILHLEGTPAEMGRQQAILLKDSLLKFREDSWRCVEATYLKDKPMLKMSVKPMAYRTAREYLPEIPEEYQAEMKALAENSGVSFDDILLLNVINEVTVDMSQFLCTSLAVNDVRTPDGSLLHAYNTDAYMSWDGTNCLDKYKGVVFYQPDKGHKFATVSVGGYAGVFCGMNEKGISVSVVHPLIGRSQPGRPMRFLLRGILQHTGSLAEALALVQSVKLTIPGEIMIADGLNNDVAIIHMDPANDPQYTIEKIKGGALVTGRGEREFNRLYSGGKKLGITELVKFLRYQPDDRFGICSQETSYSTIFHPASGRFWVALGPTPAPLAPFYGFSLATEKRLQGKAKLFPSVIPATKTE